MEQSIAGFDPIEYINTPRWQQSRLGLERIVELMDLLGNPQNDLKFVHVAGTNGKGSTCNYLANILRCAGYKTGLFTSPYIHEFAERIQVNGQNISADALLEVTLEVKAAADKMADHPTEFELMTAVALVYFAKAGCDICVLEVGMGGRLDSTNVIRTAELCMITSIALDHCAILGDTLAAIAGEKAGILKPGVPVVTCEQADEVLDVIKTECTKKNCALTMSLPEDVTDVLTFFSDSQRFTWKGIVGFETTLMGSYQPQNAAMALEAAAALVARGWSIPQEAMRQGIAEAKWPGRFEIISKRPTMVVDGGHNPQGAEALMDSVYKVFPGQMPVFIIGVLADKDYHEMLNVVIQSGICRNLVVIEPPNPRALSKVQLAHELREVQRDHLGYDLMDPYVAADAEEAIRVACQMAGKYGLIVAFGSLYSVDMVTKAAAKVGLHK